MISDRELWACAHTVLSQHGQQAPVVVAARTGALALQGDTAGVATWKSIARRMEQLQVKQDRCEPGSSLSVKLEVGLVGFLLIAGYFLMAQNLLSYIF
jgi:hypothetical protein